ncbi:MAG TPA: hypothetical protein DCP28_28745, partial [Cytophagales bacterium]|nr:hypothetical protein [Cytophagales bacterium]
DNLMDYGTARVLHKHQWDLIQDPPTVLGFLESEEEASEEGNNANAFFPQYEYLSGFSLVPGKFDDWVAPQTQYHFITPNGNLITLPKKVQDVTFDKHGALFAFTLNESNGPERYIGGRWSTGSLAGRFLGYIKETGVQKPEDVRYPDNRSVGVAKNNTEVTVHMGYTESVSLDCYVNLFSGTAKTSIVNQNLTEHPYYYPSKAGINLSGIESRLVAHNGTIGSKRPDYFERYLETPISVESPGACATCAKGREFYKNYQSYATEPHKWAILLKIADLICQNEGTATQIEVLQATMTRQLDERLSNRYFLGVKPELRYALIEKFWRRKDAWTLYFKWLKEVESKVESQENLLFSGDVKKEDFLEAIFYLHQEYFNQLEDKSIEALLKTLFRFGTIRNERSLLDDLLKVSQGKYKYNDYLKKLLTGMSTDYFNKFLARIYQGDIPEFNKIKHEVLTGMLVAMGSENLQRIKSTQREKILLALIQEKVRRRKDGAFNISLSTYDNNVLYFTSNFARDYVQSIINLLDVPNDQAATMMDLLISNIWQVDGKYLMHYYAILNDSNIPLFTNGTNFTDAFKAIIELSKRGVLHKQAVGETIDIATLLTWDVKNTDWIIVNSVRNRNSWSARMDMDDFGVTVTDVVDIPEQGQQFVKPLQRVNPFTLVGLFVINDVSPLGQGCNDGRVGREISYPIKDEFGQPAGSVVFAEKTSPMCGEVTPVPAILLYYLAEKENTAYNTNMVMNPINVVATVATFGEAGFIMNATSKLGAALSFGQYVTMMDATVTSLSILSKTYTQLTGEQPHSVIASSLNTIGTLFLANTLKGWISLGVAKSVAAVKSARYGSRVKLLQELGLNVTHKGKMPTEAQLKEFLDDAVEKIKNQGGTAWEEYNKVLKQMEKRGGLDNIVNMVRTNLDPSHANYLTARKLRFAERYQPQIQKSPGFDAWFSTYVDVKLLEKIEAMPHQDILVFIDDFSSLKSKFEAFKLNNSSVDLSFKQWLDRNLDGWNAAMDLPPNIRLDIEVIQKVQNVFQDFVFNGRSGAEAWRAAVNTFDIDGVELNLILNQINNFKDYNFPETKATFVKVGGRVRAAMAQKNGVFATVKRDGSLEFTRIIFQDGQTVYSNNGLKLVKDSDGNFGVLLESITTSNISQVAVYGPWYDNLSPVKQMVLQNDINLLHNVIDAYPIVRAYADSKGVSNFDDWLFGLIKDWKEIPKIDGSYLPFVDHLPLLETIGPRFTYRIHTGEQAFKDLFSESKFTKDELDLFLSRLRKIETDYPGTLYTLRIRDVGINETPLYLTPDNKGVFLEIDGDFIFSNITAEGNAIAQYKGLWLVDKGAEGLKLLNRGIRPDQLQYLDEFKGFVTGSNKDDFIKAFEELGDGISDFIWDYRKMKAFGFEGLTPNHVRAWKALESNPKLRSIRMNVDRLAKVVDYFEYGGAKGFEGLKKFLDPSRTNLRRQRFIDNLDGALKELTISDPGLVFSGINKGDVIIRGPDGQEVARFVDGDWKLSNITNQGDVIASTKNFQIVKSGNSLGCKVTWRWTNDVEALPADLQANIAKWFQEGLDPLAIDNAFNRLQTAREKQGLYIALIKAKGPLHRRVLVNDRVQDIPGVVQGPYVAPGPWGQNPGNNVPAFHNGTRIDSKYDLPSGNVPTFTSATLELIPAGTELYRVFGGSNSYPTGGYWTKVKPQNLEEVIGGTAVQPAWNDYSQLATYTVPQGGMYVWVGDAAPQPIAGPGNTFYNIYLNNYHLPGGGQQVFMPEAYRDYNDPQVMARITIVNVTWP